MSGAERSSPVVVGIGASAGGLEAIETFFDHVPPDTGAAFVVVQHLSPDFESLMDQLLARHTQLTIRQAHDDVPIEPETIYLIPPRADPSLVDGRLRLAPQGRPLGFPLPIDVFFRSLAKDAGSRGIAVILSGTGTDGSRGALAVKEAGGFVAVQAPETARFDGMPRAAVQAGVADLVMPVSDLAQRIVDLLSGGGDLAEGVALGEAAGGFDAVLKALRNATGVDFPRYKDRVLRRRVQRRMALNRCTDLGAYVALLQDDPSELRQLGRDALIRVTDFFRDPDAWRTLDEHLGVAVRLAGGVGFRAWVAGCSTGEEAYSLAMLLDEWATRSGSPLDFRVFATDVDRDAIAFAQHGRYPAGIVESVGAERCERHFHREDDECVVRRELRQRIVFARHDALRDPPFTRVHLTTCRNVLIYLQPDAQRDMLRRLHFSLVPSGLLWLGPSEVPLGIEGHVETVDRRWRLLRKTGELETPPTTVGSDLRVEEARRPTPSPTPNLAVAQALIEDQAAAGLLVDSADQLQHVFGDATAYLAIRAGRASRDLAGLLASEHARTVLAAVQHVRRTLAPAECQRIPFAVVGRTVVADIRVLPVPDRSTSGAHEVLLVLREVGPQAPAPAPAIDFDIGERMTELEAELSRTRGNLQATIEELETANEELQSTNEELLASNEELQSTNEELHSVNEELHTVNAEHQRKIEELTQLADDVENLLASTEIGVVFLDRELRIRRFTPAATEVLPILRGDIGRPIADLRIDVRGADLSALASAVLEEGARIERQAIDGRGVRRLFRFLPYRTHLGVQGAVLSMVRLAAPGDPALEPVDFASTVARITATLDAAAWTLELPEQRLELFLAPKVTSLFGFERAALATDPDQLFGAALSEDADDFRTALRDSYGTGQLHTVFRVRDPNGRVRHLQVDAVGIRGADGDVTRLFGAVHELTRG